MGMFDYFKINANKLPLTQEERERYGDRFSFQTKDIDCTLTDVVIDDDGRLIIKRFKKEYIESSDDFFPTIGQPNKENGFDDVQEHQHGFVNFYDYIDGELLEFNAKYTDGKLVEIIRLSPPMTSKE